MGELETLQGARATVLRKDGTPKGEGYFGQIPRPDGDFSTELSLGVNLGGKDMEIPSIVPTLTHAEIQHLLRLKQNERMWPSIQEKAVQHAKSRLSAGQSVWAHPDELYPLPMPALGGLQGQ